MFRLSIGAVSEFLTSKMPNVCVTMGLGQAKLFSFFKTHLEKSSSYSSRNSLPFMLQKLRKSAEILSFLSAQLILKYLWCISLEYVVAKRFQLRAEVSQRRGIEASCGPGILPRGPRVAALIQTVHTGMTTLRPPLSLSTVQHVVIQAPLALLIAAVKSVFFRFSEPYFLDQYQ